MTTIRLSAAARAALALALAGDGRLHRAPPGSGLTPRVRWNVAVTLEAGGFLVMESADPRANIYTWALTEEGRARAMTIPSVAALVAPAATDTEDAA